MQMVYVDKTKTVILNKPCLCVHDVSAIIVLPTMLSHTRTRYEAITTSSPTIREYIDCNAFF
jgi:hypothetical protein